jgi:hypothetical protein
MSLKRKEQRMLGIDQQPGRWREVKPGTDAGVFGIEPGGWVSRQGKEGDLCTKLKKASKGLVKSYLGKIIGMSRAQMTHIHY